MLGPRGPHGGHMLFEAIHKLGLTAGGGGEEHFDARKIKTFS